MAKVGKFCLAKRVKVEWLFQTHFAATSGRMNITARVMPIHLISFLLDALLIIVSVYHYLLKVVLSPLD